MSNEELDFICDVDYSFEQKLYDLDFCIGNDFVKEFTEALCKPLRDAVYTSYDMNKIFTKEEIKKENE